MAFLSVFRDDELIKTMVEPAAFARAFAPAVDFLFADQAALTQLISAFAAP